MRNQDSPYLFGEIDDDEPLDEDGEPETSAVDRETVIVEGSAMSYRSYLARRDSE
jgi:hypothetical protein